MIRPTKNGKTVLNQFKVRSPFLSDVALRKNTKPYKQPRLRIELVPT